MKWACCLSARARVYCNLGNSAGFMVMVKSSVRYGNRETDE